MTLHALQQFVEVTLEIAGRQWSCKLHSYQVDMTSYYSAHAIPTYTGFIMDFGSNQQFTDISFDPDAFGFNPDIVIATSAGGIVQIIRSLKTKGITKFSGTARYFIAVNAGEMSGISAGSLVVVKTGEPGTPAKWSVGTVLAWYYQGRLVVARINYVNPLPADPVYRCSAYYESGELINSDAVLYQSDLVASGAFVYTGSFPPAGGQPVTGIDLSSMIGLMVVVMMMGLMMKEVR